MLNVFPTSQSTQENASHPSPPGWSVQSSIKQATFTAAALTTSNRKHASRESGTFDAQRRASRPRPVKSPMLGPFGGTCSQRWGQDGAQFRIFVEYWVNLGSMIGLLCWALNTISFERGPWGERLPGRTAKRSQNWNHFGAQDPIHPEDPFQSKSCFLSHDAMCVCHLLYLHVMLKIYFQN